MEKPEPEIKNIPLNLKSRLFLIYLRFKSLSYKIAFLALIAIIYTEFHYHRLKLTNNNPWNVTDVISGDRFTVSRGYKKLEIQLCGISAKSNESKDYLRSLISQGDGWVVLDRVSKQDGLTVAEVFVQRHDEQEIHLNTEMLMGGKAILSNYKACPNAEYFEMAAEFNK